MSHTSTLSDTPAQPDNVRPRPKPRPKPTLKPSSKHEPKAEPGSQRDRASMIAAVAAILSVLATVVVGAYTQYEQRVTQRQTNFTTASQQLAAADTFSQAAGITTLANLAKNDPATYGEPVCQIVPPYITQAVTADLAHAPKPTKVDDAPEFPYRPGVLLAIQYISGHCGNWAGFKLTRWFVSDVDLTGANLADADLTYSNLYRSDLAHAYLAGANLTYADLTDADLTDADLTDAKLTRIKYDKYTMWPRGFVPPPSR